MALVFPLLGATLVVRVLSRLLVRRGNFRASRWDHWPAACASGMSVVFVLTGVMHFIEPARSGLISIVPTWVPQPAVAVAVTGVIEFVLAVGLLVPMTRRRAAVASAALLVALFPANVVAAGGVDHLAAPSTALLPRTLLQILFIVVCGAAMLRARPTHSEHGFHHENRISASRPAETG